MSDSEKPNERTDESGRSSAAMTGDLNDIICEAGLSLVEFLESLAPDERDRARLRRGFWHAGEKIGEALAIFARRQQDEEEPAPPRQSKRIIIDD